MDLRLRLTFFCGTCLGLAVGFAAGHISVWQNVIPSQIDGVSFQPSEHPLYSDSMGSAGFDFPMEIPEPEPDARTPAPGGAVVLNDPDEGDEPVHADALVEIPYSAAELPVPSSRPVSPPHSFPGSQSKPLTHPATTLQAQAVSPEQTPLDPEVFEMLRDELQGVSEQHREVWGEALRGMSPSDAAGVILMWKKFGQKGAGAGPLGLPPTPFDASHPEAVPHLLAEPAPRTGLLPTPPAEDDLGLRIAQHNQANRETCGYLEMLPVSQEVAFDPLAAGERVRVIGYRLKVKPGRLVDTGNPSHVAVQRECFFAVKLPTGEEQFTRVGRLVLDAERRLCIDLGDRDLPVAPEVKLPDGATRFTVQSGQLQVAVEGQAEPMAVGLLQVAEFFDASRLQPMGGGLYGATTASGKPKMVAAELVFQSLEYPLIEGVFQNAAARRIKSDPVADAHQE